MFERYSIPTYNWSDEGNSRVVTQNQPVGGIRRLRYDATHTGRVVSRLDVYPLATHVYIAIN